MVLLYGQTPARTCRLTTAHVIQDDKGVALQLHEIPLRLPQPLDALVLRLVDIANDHQHTVMANESCHRRVGHVLRGAFGRGPPLEQLYAWRPWPEWVTAPLNDGVEVFALPKRLTRALGKATSAELEELATRWTTRLRSEDGDDMTDDDLLAVLQDVGRLAASAANTGGGLYSWSF
ncbi:hypothetical protein [Streptomyces sp. NPDC056323]|uniref:hypothetical protein n=1 Tax=Streptomyces sp. NPDC056323 TaxID=3345784 RepID=UPI0035DB3425